MKEKRRKGVAYFEITLLIFATIAFSYIVHEANDNSISSESESVFLIVFLSLRGLFFDEKTLVSAQEVEAAYTCLKSKDGKICQEYTASECNSKCDSSCIPTPRSDVDACKLGTCYDSKEGTCQTNSPKINCEAFDGKWLDDPFGNQPECKKGCCVLGGKNIFATDQGCVRQSALLGLEKKFNPLITTELGCELSASGFVEGACVIPSSSGEKNDCTFTSQEICAQKTGNFYPGYLCSNPALNTRCEKQKTTGCVEGKDEVMWFDSCGNKENIYDANKLKSWNDGKALLKNESCNIFSGTDALANQKTCGNCVSLIGSRCGLKTSSESLADSTQGVVCKDLSCVDEDGKKRSNGESWCDYQGSIGTADDSKGLPLRSTDVAGSKHFKKVCVDGEIRTEPCADFRGEICVEGKANVSATKTFSAASCTVNRWQECMLYNNELKKKGSSEGNLSQKQVEQKCTDNPDCYVKKINVDDGFKFNVCAPRYPPGFDLENNADVAEKVCNFASQKCTVVYIKDISGWKCIANCDCETAKFTQQMNDFCMSLGDCGAKANAVGEVTSNYKVKGAPKLGKNYLATLASYAKPVPGKFASPGNLSQFLGLVGIPSNVGEANVPGSGGVLDNLATLGSLAGSAGPGLLAIVKGDFSLAGIFGGATSAAPKNIPTANLASFTGGGSSFTPAGQITSLGSFSSLTGSNIPFDSGFHLFSSPVPITASGNTLQLHGYYVDAVDGKAYPVTGLNNLGVDRTIRTGIFSSKPIEGLTQEQLAQSFNKGELAFGDTTAKFTQPVDGEKIFGFGDKVDLGNGKILTGNNLINYDSVKGTINNVAAGGNPQMQLSGSFGNVQIGTPGSFITNPSDLIPGNSYNIGSSEYQFTGISSTSTETGEQAGYVFQDSSGVTKTLSVTDAGFSSFEAGAAGSTGNIPNVGGAGAFQTAQVEKTLPSTQAGLGAFGTAMAAISIASSIYGLYQSIFGAGPHLLGSAIQSGIGLVLAILPLAGVALGPFGAIAGILITIIFKLLGIGKTKKVIVKFTCQAWQPPVGGAKCSQCGADGFPCSKYTCQSLGQRCEFINEGTDNELCVSVSPDDKTAPIISAFESALNGSQFSYTDISGSGYTLKSSENDGCVKAYENVNLGISTNEAAQCKVDSVPGGSFEDMEFDFGESSLYEYNHSMEFSIPSLESLGIPGYDPNKRADMKLYVKCQDKSGNVNGNDYTINFCIRPGDDVTPPVVKSQEPDGDYVSFTATSQDTSILVNEPAECKWDTSDKDYDSMANSWNCANDIEDAEKDGWRCQTNLPVSAQENTYYTRCKDQPWFAGVNETKRNTMGTSYKIDLKRTQSPLKIDSLSPDNKTIKVSTPIASVEVLVQTSGGLDGNAICGFSFGGDSFVNFIESGGTRHRQVFQSFTPGDKTIIVRCTDRAGNIAERSARFSIEMDTTAPEVSRVFGSQGNLVVITNEPADCSYMTSKSGDNSCGFSFINSTMMQTSGESHSATVPSGSTAYVKCKDSFGNMPGGCSIIVKTL